MIIQVSNSRFMATIIFTVLFTSMPGCLSLPKVETTIHDSPRGFVALRSLPEQHDTASHPITLNQSTLRTILSGLYVQEQKAFLEGLVTEEAVPIRVFTDEDIQFLLPYLQEAFSQATAEEEVVIHLTYNAPGGRKQTMGSVFVQEGNLYVTVNNFQSTISRGSLRARSSYGHFRPKLWSLRYDPETHLEEKSLQQTTERALPNTVILRLGALVESTQSDPAATLKSIRQTDEGQEEEIRQEIEELRQSIQNQEQQLEQLEQRMKP